MKKKIIISLTIFVIAIVCFSLFFCGKGKQEVSYDTAVVGECNISNSVTATGTIEPVTSVDVGTQVSGIVDKIYVDYNSVVKKGQLIAELDKTNLISELNIAKANLSDALSNLRYQQANYKRYNTLHYCPVKVDK